LIFIVIARRSRSNLTLMYEVAAGAASPRNDMIAASGFALLAMTFFRRHCEAQPKQSYNSTRSSLRTQWSNLTIVWQCHCER